MVSYKCTTCSKIFNHKHNYLRHKKRKYPCKKMVKKNIDLKKHIKLNKNKPKKVTINAKLNDEKNDKILLTNFTHFKNKKQPKKVNKVDTTSEKLTDSKMSKKKVFFKNKPFSNASKKTFKGGQKFKNKNSINKKYKCYFCSKMFIRKYNLQRHVKVCANKNTTELKKTEINQLLSLFNKKKTIVNNIVINNIDNSINDNSTKINVVAYGKENMANIPNSVKKAILNKGFRAVEALTRYTHLNKNFPENHNIYNSNLKNSLLNVYSGDKWLVQDEKDIIDDIYDIKKCHLEDWAEELIDDIGSMTKKKINRYLDYSDDDDVMKTIKRQLSLLLYNYKEIVFKTIKEKKLHKK